MTAEVAFASVARVEVFELQSALLEKGAFPAYDDARGSTTLIGTLLHLDGMLHGPTDKESAHLVRGGLLGEYRAADLALDCKLGALRKLGAIVDQDSWLDTPAGENLLQVTPALTLQPVPLV